MNAGSDHAPRRRAAAAAGTGILSLVLVIVIPALPHSLRGWLLVAAVSLGYGAAAMAALPLFPRASRVVTLAGVALTAAYLALHVGGVEVPRIEIVAAAAIVPPAVLALAWVRKRTERARLLSTLNRVATPATAQRALAALALMVRDSDAELLLRRVGGQGWLLRDGEPVGEIPWGPDRRVYLAGAPEAPVAALVLTDPPHVSRRRIEVAMDLALPVLASVQLQAELAAQLRELRRSRERIVRAAVDERHRLARDLHDGAQQRLLVLSAQITRLGVRLGDGPARSDGPGDVGGQALSGLSDAPEQQDVSKAILEAQGQLRAALNALRGLSRELYPPALETDGFAACLESLGDRLGLDVVVEGPVVDGVQRDVLVVAFLAVDDLARHLPPESDGIHVTLAVDGGRAAGTEGASGIVTLRVTAIPAYASLVMQQATWLEAATDRVVALGGTLVVSSPGDQPVGHETGPRSGQTQEAEWLEVSLPFA